MKDSLVGGGHLETEKVLSVSCGGFPCFQRPDFLPKGFSSRAVQRVLGEQPALWGVSLSLAPSRLPSWPPPALGEAGASLAAVRCQERGAFQGLAGPPAWRRFIGRFPGFSLVQEAAGRGRGRSSVRGLRLFLRRMFLGCWAGMWPNPTRVLSAFLSQAPPGTCNIVKILDLLLLRAWV